MLDLTEIGEALFRLWRGDDHEPLIPPWAWVVLLLLAMALGWWFLGR